MKIMGMHIDLKAQRMNFPFLLEVLEDLAQKGFNTILLEYQDKFPYQGKLRELAGEDALTLEQVREIKAVCRENGLEIIPMVQSIGHMYWVTRHDAYAHLGEHYSATGKGSHSLCPSKKGSFELFKTVSQQVMELHSDSRYFHIGGDEVIFSEACASCAGKDKGELLGKYYQEVLDYTVSKGFIPAMWGDMVLKYDRVRGFIPKETLIFDWEYALGLSAENKEKVFGDCRRWEDWGDCAFDGAIELAQEGFRVVTAPATRSNGDAAFLGRNVHFENCIEAYLTAQQINAEGIVVTSWAVRRVPWQLTDLSLVAVSELHRNSQCSAAEIIDRFCEENFGVINDELRDLPFRLGSKSYEAWKAADFISSGQDYMDAATGRFLSFSIEYRLRNIDIRHNETVRNAYLALQAEAKRAQQVLKTARPVTRKQLESVEMWNWAAENALFYGEYVADLCQRFDDRSWLEEMLCKLDRFAEENTEKLAQYYTDFSMLDEYHSRIEVHKDYLLQLLAAIS